MPFINDRLQENQERLAREERASRPERALRFVFEPEAVMARLRARIVGQARCSTPWKTCCVSR